MKIFGKTQIVLTVLTIAASGMLLPGCTDGEVLVGIAAATGGFLTGSALANQNNQYSPPPCQPRPVQHRRCHYEPGYYGPVEECKVWTNDSCIAASDVTNITIDPGYVAQLLDISKDKAEDFLVIMQEINDKKISARHGFAQMGYNPDELAAAVLDTTGNRLVGSRHIVNATARFFDVNPVKAKQLLWKIREAALKQYKIEFLQSQPEAPVDI